jgi:Na+/phosphate symporter
MEKEMSEKMMGVCRDLIRALELTFLAFRRSNEKSIKEAEEARKRIQRSSTELTRFLIEKGSSGDTGKEWVKPYLSLASSFDRMGYNLDGILDRLGKMIPHQILFTERAIKEMNDVFQETIDLLGNLPDLILTRNKLLAQQMGAKGKEIFKKAEGYAEEHEQRLIQGVCMPKSAPLYLDILVSLEGIIAQAIEISGKIVPLSARA